MELRYPYAVMEDDSRFFLWGSLDIGRFIALTPNAMAHRLPAFETNPRELRAGSAQVFDSVYKVFPKPENDYTQVVRWYVRHMFSSNPLTRNIVKYHPNTRYFTSGNMHWYHPHLAPKGYDGWRNNLRDLGASNVWFAWWANWNEEYPCAGNWVTYDGRHLSAAGLKEEIAYLKALRLNVYLCFRQFLVEEGCHDNRPPYRRWLGRDAEGKRMAFLDYPVPRPEDIGGVKTISWTMADFGDAGFRQWYVEQVKRAVEFYDPDGIAWDMGWNGLYSHNAPEVGVGHGTIWVQHAIYEWLKARYPQKRVVVNEALGSPSQLFADATMIEGSWISGSKTELDFQSARAFDTTNFGFQLFDDYAIQFAPVVPARSFRYLVVCCRARGPGEVNAELLGVRLEASPDDRWHVFTFDVQAKGIRDFRMGSLRLEALTDAESALDLRYAAFTNSPWRSTEPPVEQSGETLLFENGRTPPGHYVIQGKWNPRPALARVEAGDGFLRFYVRGKGGSAVWVRVTSVRRQMIEAGYRMLAYGAVWSEALLPDLGEINAFSAQVAAMKPISEKRAFRVTPLPKGEERGVVGCLWRGSNGQVAAAFFHDCLEERGVTIELDQRALARPGRSVSPTNLWLGLYDMDGQSRAARAFFKVVSDERRLVLKGLMGPRNLLLVRNVELYNDPHAPTGRREPQSAE